VYQQLNHGISASILFLLIGYLYQRRGSTQLKDFGGLKAQVPILAAIFLIGMLSSVGLPGTNGFVGEFLILLGAFQAGYGNLFSLGLVIVAAFGVVLTAVYLLYMFQQVFYGEITNDANRTLPDLKTPEIALAGVLVIFILWGGLAPNTFLSPMKASVNATIMMATGNAGKRPIWDSPEVPLAFYKLQAPKFAHPVVPPAPGTPPKRMFGDPKGSGFPAVPPGSPTTRKPMAGGPAGAPGLVGRPPVGAGRKPMAGGAVGAPGPGPGPAPRGRP